MSHSFKFLVAILATSLVGSALTFAETGSTNTGTTPTGTVGMANPASVNCIKLGGTLISLKDANGGEYANCKLPNGTVCEEWKLYRKECNTEAKCDKIKLSDTEKAKLKTNIKTNLTAVNSNWKAFHADSGYLWNYMRKPMKKADRVALRAIIKTNRDDFDKLISAKIKDLHSKIVAGETIDLDAVKTELNAMIADGMHTLQTKVASYVDISKQEAFGKFIEARITTMQKNMTLRLDNAATRKLFKQCKTK